MPLRDSAAVTGFAFIKHSSPCRNIQLDENMSDDTRQDTRQGNGSDSKKERVDSPGFSAPSRVYVARVSSSWVLELSWLSGLTLTNRWNVTGNVEIF